MKPKLNAIYISVKNMNKAVKFYEDLLETSVSIKSERMSTFTLENIEFLLFNPEMDNEKAIFGSNVIPNFEVENIQKYIDFAEKNNCEIIMPLEIINEYLIFQIKDLDGNIIEFYEVKKA